MRVTSFLARHATMILIALFVLVVTTATTACRRGPVLDMRGGEARVVSLVSLSSAVADGAILATMAGVHPRSTAGSGSGQWTEYASAVSAARAIVVEAPHLLSGACARGFATAPSVGPLCYRSCGSDADCSDETTCSRKGRSGARVCVAR